MKLHKNIFKITDDNIDFLLYLYEHPKFTVRDICKKFDLNYSTLFNHLKVWVNQGFIIEERLLPQLGKPKFKYSLSEKACEKLNKIKISLSNKLN